MAAILSRGRRVNLGFQTHLRSRPAANPSSCLKPDRHYMCVRCAVTSACVNTLGLQQNGRLLPDDIFKCIFLNENVWIFINISLKFVSKGPNNNIRALAQIMAWCRLGDKPLSEPMMVCLLMHICITPPQWFTTLGTQQNGHKSADNILKRKFWWMKIMLFWLKFNWRWFP